jgi:hypothetical protein
MSTVYSNVWPFLFMPQKHLAHISRVFGAKNKNYGNLCDVSDPFNERTSVCYPHKRNLSCVAFSSAPRLPQPSYSYSVNRTYGKEKRKKAFKYDL